VTIYDLLRRLCGGAGMSEDERQAATALISDLERLNALGTTASEQQEAIIHTFRARAWPSQDLCADCNRPEEEHQKR
jgi:hypothetical protein